MSLLIPSSSDSTELTKLKRMYTELALEDRAPKDLIEKKL